MRLIDADALIEEAMERYCNDCERRKGVKNGKWKIVYSIGDAPCRACGTGDMIDELENAPTIEPEPHWIPVTERLPKVGKTVICQCRADILKLLKLDSGGDWYQDAEHAYMSGFVLAWMPLPPVYKENENERS